MFIKFGVNKEPNSMEFLRKNAEYLERKALEAFEEGEYRFAIYFAEQALQLHIKYILAKQVGDYPKTHSFSSLFKALDKVVEGAEEFYKMNSDIFDLLEDAYISVRYLGKEFSELSARRALDLIRKFREAFEGGV